MRTGFGIMAMAAAALAPAAARAQAADYGAAADCPALISRTEAQRNIPHGLLMAIALTESGRGGIPSPYAMNIAGRAYFAQSGQEMASIVSSQWQRGVQSIDVGCMQVNLKYHGMRFQHLTDLIDSGNNVSYGASYLISLAVGSGSWKDAVMSYHNRNNPSRRAWYGCKVWNNYLRINGQQTGYLQCGGAPTGSTTASAATMTPIAAQANVWSRSASAGPLAGGRGTAIVGGQSVDVPVPARRVEGTIALVRDGQTLPDVVSDDARQSAFTSVRPTDWSARRRSRGAAAEIPETAPIVHDRGFGWVPASH